jgi:CHASE3 domain sensor protein
MDRVRARRHLVPAVLSILTIVIAALAVWLPAAAQRRASDRIFAETRSIQGMLTAMLDQETGLRGYALTKQSVFLAPYRTGRREFDAANVTAEGAAGGDDRLRARIEAAEAVAREWQSDAEATVAAAAGGDPLSAVRTSLQRKAIMDRFRARIASAMALVDERRRSEQSRAQTIPVIAVTALSVLFLLLAYRLILRPRILAERADRRARRYAEARHEFTETMQMAGSEDEAHTLLKHHIERTVEGAEAIVLKRNNSENRLEPGTTPDDERIVELLADTDARSCLSIRYGRRHHEAPDAEPLLSCALCRSIGDRETTGMPSLDRFKALNDDFGHETGNDVLAAAAQALQGALRASDFVGRYGGEEFVALLPDTDRDGGLGVASMPEDGPDGAALLRQADRALYRAKELGRNRVEGLARPFGSRT